MSANVGRTPPPPRFVLDLRKPPPPPSDESESERCSRLENEVRVLKETQKALLSQVSALTRQLHESGPRPANAQAFHSSPGELEQTRAQLRKLQEDHKIALELIVALGATFAHHSPSGSSSTNKKKVTYTGGTLPTTPLRSTKKEVNMSSHETTRPPFVPTAPNGDSFNTYAINGSAKKKNSSPAAMLRSTKPHFLEQQHRADRIGE